MKKNDPMLELCASRAKYAFEMWSKQRQRERDDLKFQDPEEQWDSASKRAREGGEDSGVSVPPRPMLSVTQIHQPIELVLNQQKQAHLGVNIHPLTQDADKETAEIFQDYYRKIERDSDAQPARDWAYDRAVKAGFGCYRILTEYDDEGGNPFDQIVKIERIPYQESVYLDPAAEKVDFSDGQFAFVTSWLSERDFKRQYKGAKLPGSDDLVDTVTTIPEWVNGEGSQKRYLVAEYWYKEPGTETIYQMDDGSVLTEDELPPILSAEAIEALPSRELEKHTVMMCKVCTGADPLQLLEGPSEWNGAYIPLVPVLGKELQPFDSERRLVGMIRNAKSAQKLTNFAASNLVEAMSMEPKAPWQGTAKQIEGYESEYRVANRRNIPVLHYNADVVNGQLLQPPFRVQVDGTKMQLAIQALGMSKDFVQTTMATYDPSLGAVDSHKSGRAIQSLQDQSSQANSGFLYNMANYSMKLEAKIVLDLIANTHDRKGRIIQTLSPAGDISRVMLNQPYVEKDGRITPIEAGAQMGGAKTVDLTRGKYAVSITIGKSYQSRLEEGNERIGQFLQAQPQYMPALGPLWLQFQDFAGSSEMAEIMKKIQAQQMPFLQEQEGEASPELMRQQLTAAKQKEQEMMGAIQQMQQQMQLEVAKQQAIVAKTKLDNQTKLQVATMDNETELQIAAMRAKSASEATAGKIADTVISTGHQRAEADRDRAHDLGMAHANAALEPVDLNFKRDNDTPLQE